MTLAATNLQSSTPRNLACSLPPPNTDTGSPSSGVPRTDTVRQQNSVAGGQPQNPVAPGPSHGPPRGQQGVVQRWPSQLPTQFSVMQRSPLQAQFIPPFFLFQYSFGTLSDYCGTLISKMNMDYRHEYPFYMRDEYKTDYPSILDAYAKAVRVLDYMT
ncbi:hypothetical protein HPB50_020008 [Hyalomma asiaticum]|uniref:Uncharacterized protein n=1 Tax=Hyalomma asiaticum TaxID=266040 RepID=A0ACB7SLT5_HYAAI|nr:hypothetical protein HPB50_020008 [Hyalomma asiaticum]